MKNRLTFAAVAVISALASCQGPDPSPPPPSEPGYHAPLLIINNSGYDFTFYLGDFNPGNEAESIVVESSPIADGGQLEITEPPYRTALNVWISYEPNPGFVYYVYCTAGGILGKFVLSSDRTYTLDFPTCYSYTFVDDLGKNLLGDWDITVTDSRPFGTSENPHQYLLAPRVNVINSPEWDVEASYLTNDFAQWVRGLTSLTYTGASTRNFVRIFVRYRNKDGKPAYFDASFFRQANLLGLSSINANTNTFVSPAMNSGYYHSIENLADYSVSFSDLDEMDVILEGDVDDYEAPIGAMSLNGPMDTTSSSSFIYQPVLNSGAGSIQSSFTMCYFKDSGARETQWEYCGLYQESGGSWTYNSVLVEAAAGRLEIFKPHASNFTETYSVSNLFLEWEPYTAPEPNPSIVNASGLKSLAPAPQFSKSMAPEERNMRLRDWMDARDLEVSRAVSPDKLFSQAADK